MSNTVIPREQLSAYQRWELSSFDDNPAPATKPAADEIRTDENARRNGYEAGYLAGTAAAEADARRAAGAAAAQLEALLAAARKDLSEIDTQLADELLDLALTLARRLAGDALRIRPELVLPLVSDCLRASGRARAPAQLMLNPADAQLVREHLGEQCTAGGWVISEDATLSRGGCRLESAGGSVDASLECRWQRLLSAFGREGEWLDLPESRS